jgi:GNAT superfamily N-acetyltransferase
MASAYSIRRLYSLDNPATISALTDILVDCVEGGASVSFMLPLARTHAENFWHSLADDVAAGKRILLVAEDSAGEIAGTVQAILSQPDNQPHRADIAKMLVHRKARRNGLGAALMIAIEKETAAAGKTLLVLDTVTGGDAERLYSRLGWQLCGQIPDYAMWPKGGFCATTIFYKPVQINR